MIDTKIVRLYVNQDYQGGDLSLNQYLDIIDLCDSHDSLKEKLKIADIDLVSIINCLLPHANENHNDLAKELIVNLRRTLIKIRGDE